MHKKIVGALGLATVGLLLFGMGIDVRAQSAAKTDDPDAIVYHPPMRGAPKVRTGGASRGVAAPQVVLEALAPEEVGLTTAAQPTFYYYVSGPVRSNIQFTISPQVGIKPLLEVNLPRPGAAGIYAVHLGAFGRSLDVGGEYDWVVAVITDSNARSNDVLATGAIRRVAPDAALQARLDHAAPLERAALMSQAGLWYDALDQLSQASDPKLLPGRVALLNQVGLADAASFTGATTR